MSLSSPLSCSSKTLEDVTALFATPFCTLLAQAHAVHCRHFDPQEVQLSTLLNIKTGGCSENCAYCSQSSHHHTTITEEKLLDLDTVIAAAKRAKAAGATRFCMAAAWRGPRQVDLDHICQLIRAVKALGLQTCVSLGLLRESQVQQLKRAGLDVYNHNIDTSQSFYSNIITTRRFQDRLDTIERVQRSGIELCCGGILGMGETREDRAEMLWILSRLKTPPQSIPINRLIPIPGTPMENVDPIDPFEVIRTIAVARILFPTSMVRLSAGRDMMNDEWHALCFFGGANSIFYGEALLTTDNAEPERDQLLFERLDLRPQTVIS